MIKKRNLVLIVLLVSLTGCDPCSEEPETCSKTIEQSWELYEDGQYGTAIGAFECNIGAHGAQAYLGLGWSHLKLDNMAQANANFTNASNIIDANAGWTFVKWALEEYSECITKADAVLSADPDYIFGHDSAVTYNDLILHQAYSYFHLGNYSNCILKIIALDASFIADPNDPNIEEILLVKLEELIKNF